MIASRDQNQFPSSFAPLGDFLKAHMFLSNLNDFNSSPLLPDQGFAKWKGSSKVWKEKSSKWFCHLFSLSPSCFYFALLLCFALLFWVSLVLCIALFNLFLFVFFSVLVYFVFHIKIKKKNWKKLEKDKNSVCLCTLVHVYHGWPLKQNFINFVSFVA